MLKKIAPEAKIKKMVKGNLTLKKAALSFVDAVDFLNKQAVARVALNTVKGYQDRAEGDTEIKDEIKADPKQLIQRVQNEVITQISNEIKKKYYGEKYEWLPSDAEEPDPKHQLKYGKIFVVGKGEMPGERYGCKCGMRILVNETQLELG